MEVSKVETDQKEDKYKLTYTESFIICFKCCLGIGILAGPASFRDAGWLTGLCLSGACVSLLTYSMHILFRCKHEVANLYGVSYFTYAEAVRFGFKKGPKCVQKLGDFTSFCVRLLTVILHFCGAGIYIKVLGAVLHTLLSKNNIEVNTKVMMLLLTPLISLLLWIKQLKNLISICVVGILSILISFGIIIFNIITNGPSVREHSMINDIFYLPLFASVTMFALFSVGLLLAIEGNMRKPEHFVSTFGVLNMSTLASYVLFVSFSMICCWRLGKNDGAFIMWNMHSSNKYTDTSIKVLIALALFLSYPIHCFPVIQIVWREYMMFLVVEEQRNFYEVSMRMMVLVFTLIFALAVPYPDIIIYMIGILCTTVLSLLIPALLDISVKYPNNFGICYIAFIRDIVLVIISIAIISCGIMAIVIIIMRKFV